MSSEATSNFSQYYFNQDVLETDMGYVNFKAWKVKLDLFLENGDSNKSLTGALLSNDVFNMWSY